MRQRVRRRVILSACALLWLGAHLSLSPPASARGPASDDGGNPSVTVLGRGAVRWRSLLAADRTTLLVFATTWCAACRREQPQVLRWARAQADAVRTLYIYSGSSAAEVRRKLREHQLPTDARALPILVDAEGSVAARYAIRSTPTLLHLRADGRLLGRYRSLAELPPPQRPSHVAQKRVVVRDSGRELGTSYEVWLLVAEGEAPGARSALAAARARVHELEQQLSEWRDDSEISRVNRLADQGEGKVELSPTLAQLVRGSLGVSRLTGGAFDITWGPINRLWHEAAQRQVWPDEQALHRALQAVGYQRLRLDGRTLHFQQPGMALGIGGVAKGWIVDAVHALLRARGLRDLVVKIGGDMRTSGRDADGNKHAFQLADPYHLGRSAGSLGVADTAIATSGNYLRHERVDTRTVGHILDPRTGRPPAFDGSVTVLTRDSALADALSTALFVMGPEQGLRFARGQAGIEVLYLTRHGPVGTLPAP
ncbi:MAG: FAD:protein FMN transferase [Proteobacteria bacterium]|nr:FAD:protein FMN transferase [Pseudomonadota bacterium]